MSDFRRELIDLADRRSRELSAAENALTAKDQEAYKAAMETVKQINERYDAVDALLKEQERVLDTREESPAETRDRHGEIGSAIARGESFKVSSAALRKSIKNSTTLYTAPIAEPTLAGEMNGLLGAKRPGILDRVNVMDLAGTGGIDIPFVKALQTAYAANPAASGVAGTARTAADPTFALAPIKPYEVTTTSFVDRNIMKLSPVLYGAEVEKLAMQSMLRKVSDLVMIGDSELSTHLMYGMRNGTDKGGTTMVGKVETTTLTAADMDAIYFAYGDDYDVGGNPMLMLKKADLTAIGKLRGTNEKGKLFSIVPDANNSTMGVIQDGGTVIPYFIANALTALSASSQGAAAIETMVFGDPSNYTLGLFGDYEVRLDESVKAQERMIAILGDAMIGGNLTVYHGAVVVTVPASA